MMLQRLRRLKLNQLQVVLDAEIMMMIDDWTGSKFESAAVTE